jgi:hypothetical protein
MNRDTLKPRPGSKVSRVISALLLGILAWAGFPGCTDTGILFLDRTPHDRVAISGSFCTARPDSFLHPIRVLFAVDSSDSMIFNDPANIHVDAIQSAVENCREEPNISFGILRWGERVIRELADYNRDDPVLFTKDETRLNEAFTRMRQLPSVNPDKFLGGTDYVNALQEIRSYLLQDTAENPTESMQHSYLVMFLTDGMPQSGDMDANFTRQKILEEIQAMSGEFPMRFDVISIVQIAIIPPEFFDLLPAMAEAGDGLYLQLTSPEGLVDHFERALESERVLLEFELGSVAVPSEPKSFFVLNENVRIAEVDGEVGYFVDSDADGLVDEIEFQLGTDPRNADTDGDGLDDLFESRLQGEFDPLATMVPGLTEEQLTDQDRDGLVMFVEERLGLDDTDPDTDDDGLIDGIEFRAGTMPHVTDAFGDPDDDGISNYVEIRQGTSPTVKETFPPGSDYCQNVIPITEPSDVIDGQRCYRFRVENIRLRETRASRDILGVAWPRGANRIRLWRVERPAPVDEQDRDSPMLDKYARHVNGRIWILFNPSKGTRDPSALELYVNDAHFEP